VGGESLNFKISNPYYRSSLSIFRFFPGGTDWFFESWIDEDEGALVYQDSMRIRVPGIDVGVG